MPSSEVAATVLGLLAAHGYTREASTGMVLSTALAAPAGAAWLLWRCAVDEPPSAASGRTRLMACAARAAPAQGSAVDPAARLARLRTLLSAGADISRRDALGACALHWAVRAGCGEVLSALLDWRGEGGGDGDGGSDGVGGKSGVRSVRLRAATRLAAALRCGDANGRSALHEASAAGRADLVRALLAAGASAGAGDTLGRTPIMAAVRAGADDAVAALVAAADRPALAARDATGWSVAILAAFLGDVRTLERLAAAGVRIRSEVSNDGRSTLHHAATKNHVRCCLWLLARGVPVDARDASGAAPLADAAFSGNALVVALLLRAGADPRARDDFGRSAEDKSRPLGRGHAPVLALLQAAYAA